MADRNILFAISASAATGPAAARYKGRSYFSTQAGQASATASISWVTSPGVA